VLSGFSGQAAFDLDRVESAAEVDHRAGLCPIARTIGGEHFEMLRPKRLYEARIEAADATWQVQKVAARAEVPSPSLGNTEAELIDPSTSDRSLA
jgi:hypothetical protein